MINKKIILSSLIVCSYIFANDVSVGVGSGYQTNIYKSKDSQNILTVPFVNYENSVFFINGLEAGLHIYKNDIFTISPLINVRFDGYKKPKGFMQGMSERKMTLDAGIRVKFKSQYGIIEAEAYHDVLDKYNGANAGLEYKYMFKYEKWGFAPSIGIKYLSKDLVDYYYGVRANEETSNRPQYKGDATVVYKTGVSGYYLLNDSWSLYSSFDLSFFGDEIKDSPIVKKDMRARGYFGVAYKF